MIALLFRSENGEIYLHREDDNPVWLMAEYACAAAVRPIHMQDYHEERSPACNSAINNQCTIYLFSIINAPSFFFRPLLSGPTIAYSCCVSGRGRYCQFWFCWCYYDIDTVGEGFGADVYLRLFPISNTNKAKCQLCKILGGPIIPRSWYGLVWKGLYLWRWSP